MPHYKTYTLKNINLVCYFFLMMKPAKGNKVTFNGKNKCIFQIQEASEERIIKGLYTETQ